MLPRAYLLTLLIPLVYLCLRRRHADPFVTGTRLLLYLVLLLGSAGLTWRISTGNGLCIAIVDRSASMSQSATEGAGSYLERLDKSRPDSSELSIISYAGNVMMEKLPDSASFTGLNAYVADPDSSRLADALESALQMMPANAPGRIVILSDGQWNGQDPSSAFSRASARNISVDYRFWEHKAANDIGIQSLEAPMSVYEGEGYVIECTVKSQVSCEAVVSLRKGRGNWNRRKVQLRKGLTHVSWKDDSEKAGTYLYTASVELPDAEAHPELDSFKENNTAVRLVTVEGRKSILVLSDSPSGNLSRILSAMQFNVVTRTPVPADMTPDFLSSFSCVILENISATRLGRSGMELLSEMVRGGSLGLIMTGGEHSFAKGGYYDSPIEAILPVDLKQRQEKRKGTIAMVVALDRSGSMSMPVDGNLTKMNLADRATCEVLSLLNEDDELGVLAVDSSSHEVLPLAKLSSHRGAEDKIMSIESMGGGIFTYTALHDATEMLLGSHAHIRHLILFADACDAEEPGKYKELLEQTSKAGITVSTIGLGKDTDCDAAFLRDVAIRGNGQFYFTDRPDDLPRVFAEDTFQVALKTFLTDPVTAHFTPQAREISSSLSGSVGFGGYNLCYAKPEINIALVTDDDNAAPLCAWHRVGLGVCAALMFEVDGQYTGAFSSYLKAAEFIGGIVNLSRVSPNDTGDYMITQSLKNGALHIEIELEPERQSDPFQSIPQVSVLSWRSGNSPTRQNMPFEWTTPHRLECQIPMNGQYTYLPSVLLDASKAIPCPPAMLSTSPEYTLDETASDRIAELCKRTGGHERLRPEEIWDRVPRQRHFANTTPLWAIIAIMLLLLEVAERRFGFLIRAFSRKPGEKRRPIEKTVTPDENIPSKKPAKQKEKTAEKQETSPEPEKPAEEESSLSKAMKQANKSIRR